MRLFLRALFIVGSFAILFGLFRPIAPVQAAVCAIAVDTVIDQGYVDDPGNNCSSIEIQGNVSTTWIGTVDLGGGVVTVKSGFTMTMGSSSAMVLGAADDFVVESNATTTHLVGDPSGVRIHARNITIQSGGFVEASEKGCPGGLLSAGSASGFGPDLSTGICGLGLAGAGYVGNDIQNHGGGGGYGGWGGGGTSYGGRTYGDSLDPTFLGSGGGSTSGYGGGFLGGSGGGRVELVASNTLTINGSVRANGGMGGSYGSFDSGAGSGGSISITAGTLAGSGSVAANGGDRAPPYYGETAVTYGGGGGRVKVLYNTLSTFDVSHIAANAGSQAVVELGAAVNGSGYILNRTADDGAGILHINSGFDFPASGDYDRDSVIFGDNTDLSCSTSTVLSVTSVTWLSLNGATWLCALPVDSFILSSTAGLSTTNTTFTFSAVTSVTVTVPTWTNVTTTISLTRPGAHADWDVSSDLTLRDFTYTGADAGILLTNGGFLSIQNPIALSLVSSTIESSVSSTLLTNLTIDNRSSIVATGKGCSGSYGNGYGPSISTGICVLNGLGHGIADDAAGGGGGYGGAGGGGGAGGAEFGISVSSTPNYFGASGGAATGGFGPFISGAGGGRVNLVVADTFTLDGFIRANGTVGSSYGYPAAGAGSGGSIYVSSTVITGSGSIQANGSEQTPHGGSISYAGGGGRVAVLYVDASGFDTSQVVAVAGSQAPPGAGPPANGSVYLSNQPPLTPTSLAPTALTDGSTTGTNNPLFRFTLTDPDAGNLVKYRIQIDDDSDFASPVVDYTSALAAQGVQSFQVGQATLGGSYSVGSVSQTLADGTYYWRVRTIDPSSSVSGYITVGSMATPAFIIDTATRTIQFQQDSASGPENVTATSVKIVLNTTHFEDVTVHYAVTGGAAEGSGTDFTLASGTATIPAGDTSTTIDLTIVNDSIAESDETIVIRLTSPTHASLGANTTHTYTITDNDAAGVAISKTSASVAEGGSVDLYTIVLLSQPTSTVTITPVANSQLSVSPTSVAFNSGNWDIPQVITIAATDDSAYEQDHSATITHSASSAGLGYTNALSIASLNVSITDNESSGGGAVGASVGLPIPTTIPLFSFTPEAIAANPFIFPVSESSTIPTHPTILRSPSVRVLNLIKQDLRSFGVVIPSDLRDQALFIEFGTTPATVSLGEGERRAIFRDLLDVLRKMPTIDDEERVASGQIPFSRNLIQERRFAPRSQQAFKTIFGHNPMFSSMKENLAWNTLLYRLRFPRDLNKEKQGVLQFKKLFKQDPKDVFQWAVVRVLGYVK